MESQNFLSKCPQHIFKEITEFLDIEDRINLSLTQHKNADVKPVWTTHIELRNVIPYSNNNYYNYREQDQQVEEQKEQEQEQNQPWHDDNLNMLYHKIDAPYERDFNGSICKLAGVHFTFLTKDQGWASVDGSSSWIEANFLKQSQLQYDQSEIERKCLVTNYCEEEFKVKTALITDAVLLKDLAQINVYLRSMYPGWRIYCKKSQVKLIYV